MTSASQSLTTFSCIIYQTDPTELMNTPVSRTRSVTSIFTLTVSFYYSVGMYFIVMKLFQI